MAVKKVRLFKIASEINIGKETIVEFLQSKGYDIQNKPTSVLTEEMVDAIYEKFKKEKQAAEVQRQKVQKHKDIRMASVNTEETKDENEEDKEKEEEKGEEKEEIQISDTEKPLKTESKIKEKKSEVPKEDIEAVEPQETKPIEIEESSTVDEKIEYKQEEVLDKDSEENLAPENKEDIKPKEIETQESEDIKGLKVVGKIDIQEDSPEPAKPKKRKKKIIKQATKNTDKQTEEPDETSSESKRKRRKPREINISRPDVPGPITEEKPGKAFTVKTSDEVRKRKRRKSIKDQISQKEIDRAIKQTLAGMDESQSGSNRAKAKLKKKAERAEKEEKLQETRDIEEKTLQLTEFVTTSDLADLMKVNSNEIILKCMELGLMVTINQRLDKETLTLIADDFGFEVEFVDEQTVEFVEEEDDDPETLKPRSPIVTIMGHVDHGKTSLLDFIRNANVVAGESGGITQHIGAYMVDLGEDKHITFLDTPGHEAFTAMRARGAKITDLVVLVCAADDNVMPQTIEAISHAKAAEVPIVVAINKIDKPEANSDRVRQQLSDNGVLVEDWGGKYQSVEISAKFGNNVELLLEKILLEAEILELKANPDRKAKGTVVEANLDKGLGSVASVVIQTGTLNQGDAFVAGTTWGRVRMMLDERNNKVDNAGPSEPVRITGFDSLPSAGDTFLVFASESEARKVATERKILKREQQRRQVRHTTLDDISEQIKIGGVQVLNLIIKADVSGSLEALSDSLLKLSRDEVKINLLHKGVGAINENDVNLAVASGAIIIAFNVNVPGSARNIASKEEIEIREYDIIYDCINDIENALIGMLRPEFKEEINGAAEVRKMFKISKVGTIAGCMVIEGKINRNDKARVLRDGLPIWSGKIHSLKREKDDVKEVKEKFECGILLDGFNDYKELDIIETYVEVEVKRKK